MTISAVSGGLCARCRSTVSARSDLAVRPLLTSQARSPKSTRAARTAALATLARQRNTPRGAARPDGMSVTDRSARSLTAGPSSLLRLPGPLLTIEPQGRGGRGDQRRRAKPPRRSRAPRPYSNASIAGRPGLYFYSLPYWKRLARTDPIRNTAHVYNLSHGLGQNHFAPYHGTK